jgi:hypothetical protein
MRMHKLATIYRRRDHRRRALAARAPVEVSRVSLGHTTRGLQGGLCVTRCYETASVGAPTPDRMCTLRATKARRRSRNSILRQLQLGCWAAFPTSALPGV